MEWVENSQPMLPWISINVKEFLNKYKHLFFKELESDSNGFVSR